MAKRTVPKPLFDYVDGAAWGEVTYRRNRSAFERWRCGRGRWSTSRRSRWRRRSLGREIALPIIAPPTGLTGLMHPDGEAAIARAAHAVGTIYTQSALSSLSIEEVHAAAPGPKWFQLYVMTDRGHRRRHARARAGRGARGAGADGRRRGRRRARARRPQPLLGPAAADGAGGRSTGVMRPRWSAGFVARPRISPGNVPATAGGAAGHAQFVNRSVRPDRDLGRPRDAARALGRPAGDQGDHARRRRASAPSSTASTRSSSPTTAAASSTTRRRRSRRCRRSPRPSAAAPSSTSTAASGAGRTSSRRSRWARGRCSSAARSSTGSARRARPASAARSNCCARELATSLALAGYPRISELGPEHSYVKSPSSGCQLGAPVGRSAYCRSAASSGVWGGAAWCGNGRRVGVGRGLLGGVLGVITRQTLNAGPADPPRVRN